MSETINIDNLAVKDKWKRRFKLFEALDAGTRSRDEIFKSKEFKTLSFKEKLAFNSFWGFIGAWLYYFYKGMHLKGGCLLAVALLWGGMLSLFDFFSGIDIPNAAYWTPISAICMLFAPLDFYRKSLFGETMWHNWPKKLHDKKGVIQFLMAVIILQVMLAFFIYHHTFFSFAAMDSKEAVRLVCGINNYYVTETELMTYGKESICAEFHQ
ncbi:hypothetical protein [uncultured Shewanella sp.]|uniref:hypothetical protein n=1 Tax=uncultured Shewanella sp. TaxID=173975 RepID=UPI00261462D1|nr:hypothetical protein [uncultured Shewanella sp.]